MKRKEINKFLQKTYDELIIEHFKREGIKNPAIDIFMKYKGDWDEYNKNFFENFEKFYNEELSITLKEFSDDFELKKECEYRWSIVSIKQMVYFDIIVIEPIYHKWFADNEEINSPELYKYKQIAYEKYFGKWCPEYEKEF